MGQTLRRLEPPQDVSSFSVDLWPWVAEAENEESGGSDGDADVEQVGDLVGNELLYTYISIYLTLQLQRYIAPQTNILNLSKSSHSYAYPY